MALAPGTKNPEGWKSWPFCLFYFTKNVFCWRSKCRCRSIRTITRSIYLPYELVCFVDLLLFSHKNFSIGYNNKKSRRVKKLTVLPFFTSQKNVFSWSSKCKCRSIRAITCKMAVHSSFINWCDLLKCCAPATTMALGSITKKSWRVKKFTVLPLFYFANFFLAINWHVDIDKFDYIAHKISVHSPPAKWVCFVYILLFSCKNFNIGCNN